MKQKHLLASLVVMYGVASAEAQGTFQNLGFESASLVPIPGDPDDRVQFGNAFPGWVGYVGDVPQTAALYNRIYLDTSGISIVDHSFGLFSGVIEGNFTALLIAGVTGVFATPADTTLSQTSLVPVSAESLRFRAYSPSGFPLKVVLGGQQLSLTPLESGTNYTLYGADVHAWQGQIAQLDFILHAQRPHVDNNYLLLDSIQLSPQAIPEPSAFGLLGLGVLCFGKWRFSKSRS